MSESKKKTQHEELRDKYSTILRGKLFSDSILQELDNDAIELLFAELTKWFGTSPPSTSAVKGELAKIVEEKLNLENVKFGDD